LGVGQGPVSAGTSSGLGSRTRSPGLTGTLLGLGLQQFACDTTRTTAIS
jgi:hypothetical protein